MATGKYAKGQCRKCGFVTKLTALRVDGYSGLMVCGDCFDIEHPAEQPVDVTDNQTLANPAPLLDAPQAVPTRLAVAMGFTNSFGGGT